MKKNILYVAFSIALLVAIPCNIKSMELTKEQKLEWIKSKATPLEIGWLNRFRTAIENKNLDAAEKIIQMFENTKKSTSGPIPVNLDEKIEKMRTIVAEARKPSIRPLPVPQKNICS